MIHRARILAITLFVVLLSAPSTRAYAFADADQVNFACDHITASGTSNAPYVFLYARIEATAEEFYTVVPVSGGRYNGELSFPKQPEGTFMNYQTWGAPALVPIYDPAYWDGEDWFDMDAACAATPFAGPGVPSGFVLRTITCDVAVYDSPGGTPVGSNQLRAGQTWYVNPTPEVDAVGEDWTEVFVSGYTNGYVPSRCVN